MSKVIKIENISKVYQIGKFSTGTLSKDFHRWWCMVRGKEDPFLRVGEKNDKSKKSESNIVWSLKNINFEVERGDTVAIIGKNGSGKSTLLKLLSKVTTPTSGSIKIKGRIASLLEVGTGFHPELTGRENIYLNGTILGMRKKEVKNKFDEIVAFSGIEKYIDTPVKRYSSGMHVRLGFAVAAHLVADILIVDEVLAVGDADFQKKCLGKMGDISNSEGRTILFVSHNMASVRKLCKRGILLDNGQLSCDDTIDKVVEKYINTNQELMSIPLSERKDRIGLGEIRLQSLVYKNKKGENIISINQGEDLYIHIGVKKNNKEINLKNYHFLINISNTDGLVTYYDTHLKESLKNMSDEKDYNYIIFHYKNVTLTSGLYFIAFGIWDKIGHTIDYVENISTIQVNNGLIYSNIGFFNRGTFGIDADWKLE